MTENKIGQEGETLNLSFSTRSMNIEPDVEHLKQFDEYPSKKPLLSYVFYLLSLSLLVWSIYLFSKGSWVLGIIVAILSLIITFFTYSFSNPLLNKRIAYESGLIIPSIIVNTNPIQLLALADVTADESSETIYGVRLLNVTQLPHHDIKMGEKVPCVALFGMAIKGYRRHYEPRPIAWGFKERTFIDQAIESISNDSEIIQNNLVNEWELLDQIQNKHLKMISHEDLTYFSENLEIISINQIE